MTNHATSGGSSHAVRNVQVGSVTVKIYEGRNRGKPSFTVIWYVGERRMRKGFSDLLPAKRFARDQAEKIAAGRVNAPSITLAQAQDMMEARRRLGPFETPIHVVAGEYADVLRQLGQTGTLRQAVEFFLHNAIRPEMHRTVTQVFEEFIASKRANGCSRVYIEDCLWRLRRFAGDFQMPISHVRTRDIEDWLGSLSTSLVTRNDFRRLIITLFNFARRRGYLSRDRETEARWLEKPRIKSKPIQIFTPQELSELLAVAVGQPRLALLIAAFTGIRSAELLRLRWENFNWEEGVIDLGCDQTKTASRRLVPILEPLRAWIAPFVKPQGSVLGYSLPVCLAEAFATAAKKAHKARKERDADATDLRWKANGLRHSYASYRLAIIEDVAKVSLEMGNSPQKVFSNWDNRQLVSGATDMRFIVRPKDDFDAEPLLRIETFEAKTSSDNPWYLLTATVQNEEILTQVDSLNIADGASPGSELIEAVCEVAFVLNGVTRHSEIAPFSIKQSLNP